MTRADRQAVVESLQRVGMEAYGKRLIGDLSGGQQQRVFIARALVSQPEVILLDEPTTGVDAHTQDDFYALLQKLNTESGITLILVSHDIDRVAREVMHVMCIDHAMKCYLSPEEFLKTEHSHFM